LLVKPDENFPRRAIIDDQSPLYLSFDSSEQSLQNGEFRVKEDDNSADGVPRPAHIHGVLL
jgi:hypothetical protein